MAYDWRSLSSELGRFSSLLGAAGATTAPTPGAGLLLGVAMAAGRLRRPRTTPQPEVPDHALIAARLRAAVEQGSLAGRTTIRRPAPER